VHTAYAPFLVPAFYLLFGSEEKVIAECMHQTRKKGVASRFSLKRDFIFAH
jgi:hypothetical protein